MSGGCPMAIAWVSSSHWWETAQLHWPQSNCSGLLSSSKEQNQAFKAVPEHPLLNVHVKELLIDLFSLTALVKNELLLREKFKVSSRAAKPSGDAPQSFPPPFFFCDSHFGIGGCLSAACSVQMARIQKVTPGRSSSL